MRLGSSDTTGFADALSELIALEEGEDVVAPAVQLAQIRVEQGDGAGAEDALERAYATCPTSPRLREELTRQYTENHSWHKLAAIRVAAAETQTSVAQRIAGLRSAASILREYAADSRGAGALLVRAYELDPTNRGLLDELVEVFVSVGEYDQARTALTKAIECGPADASLYRARARMHDALGQSNDVLHDLRGCLREEQRRLREGAHRRYREGCVERQAP